MVPIALSKVKFRSAVIPRGERKKAAEIVSGPSGKNTCLMKSSPLPRMLLEAWRRVEPKWSRKVSSAERNNCDVTAAPQARVLIDRTSDDSSTSHNAERSSPTGGGEGNDRFRAARN